MTTWKLSLALILVAILVFAGLGAVAWGIAFWYNSGWETDWQFAFAELIVELGGFSLAFLGAMWAAVEWRRAQLRPSLALLLSAGAYDSPTSRLVATADALPEVDSWTKRFYLVLDNGKGRDAARHIALSIDVTRSHDRTGRSEPNDFWALIAPDIDSAEQWYCNRVHADHYHLSLRGTENLICHDGAKLTLGGFSVAVSDHQLLPMEITFSYTVWAEAMRRTEGTLSYRLNPAATQCEP